MDVSWAATSPASRRFVPTETRSSIAILAERFEEMRAQGRGYLELRGADETPVMTFGFSVGAGVIHLLGDAGSTSLLIAEKPADSHVEVPVMDDMVEFAADFALDLDPAWEVVEAFARSGDVSDVGEWYEL